MSREWGSLNKMGRLYQYQYLGCDIILKFFKILPLGEIEHYEISLYFFTTTCEATLVSKQKKFKSNWLAVQNATSKQAS